MSTRLLGRTVVFCFVRSHATFEMHDFHHDLQIRFSKHPYILSPKRTKDMMNDVAKITLIGPKDVWFGVGFHALTMADSPWSLGEKRCYARYDICKEMPDFYASLEWYSI